MNFNGIDWNWKQIVRKCLNGGDPLWIAMNNHHLEFGDKLRWIFMGKWLKLIIISLNAIKNWIIIYNLISECLQFSFERRFIRRIDEISAQKMQKICWKIVQFVEPILTQVHSVALTNSIQMIIIQLNWFIYAHTFSQHFQFFPIHFQFFQFALFLPIQKLLKNIGSHFNWMWINFVSKNANKSRRFN